MVELTVQMKIKKDSNTAWSDALHIISKGGLVIAPTDTVYGALVDATNNHAVQRLINLKDRQPGKAISIFVSDLSMMRQYVYVLKKNERLLSNLLPGPFTTILKSRQKVVSLLESERKTLGVRIPAYKAICGLVEKYGKPLTATSANLSGHRSHYSVKSILQQLSRTKKELIDFIIDGGTLPKNKPSTIVDMTESSLKILRQGDVLLSTASYVISKSPSQTKQIAQDTISRHIHLAKKKPLVFILQGEMGAGKTIFVKGAASFLGVDDIISPTFVVSYEYPINNKAAKNLVHADLFYIDEKQEFQYLGFEKQLIPQTILCIEWGEKTGDIYNTLKEKSTIVHIEMTHISEFERGIRIW